MSRTGLIERKLNVIPIVFVTTGKRAMYPLGWKRMSNSTLCTGHYKLNSSQLQMCHEDMLKNDNKKPKINHTRNGRGASFLGTSSIFALFYMLRAQLPTTADFQLLLLKSFHPHHTERNKRSTKRSFRFLSIAGWVNLTCAINFATLREIGKQCSLFSYCYFRPMLKRSPPLVVQSICTG